MFFQGYDIQCFFKVVKVDIKVIKVDKVFKVDTMLDCNDVMCVKIDQEQFTRVEKKNTQKIAHLVFALHAKSRL